MCASAKWGHTTCIRPQHFVYDTCNAIQTFAARHALDVGFFARLIWQESRFDPNALSPANARGIAQFIPSTAELRGLKDPYNPADALAHSAQYLAEMVTRFGNEGLAAIGYNGGERRAAGFLDGGGLARETVNYVPLVTGLKAEVWRDDPPPRHSMALSDETDFLTACYTMAQNRRITPLRPPPRLDGLKPWGVEVAFARSKDAARQKAARTLRACGAVAPQEAPVLRYAPHRVATKPGFFFAQYGRDSQKAAVRLCQAMRRAGCACHVKEN